jgi:carboxypeptidase C (cathepsin A)
VRPILIAFALIGALALPVQGQPKPAEAQGSGGGILDLLPSSSVSRHEIRIGADILRYTAEAGMQPLREASGKVTAEIFHVSYVLNAPANSRPVTFVFNGGPGAASAYLHLGALGPRVLETTPDGGFKEPPQRIIDNPDTLLTTSDLVFVDPVGTGYSRAAEGTDEAQFWGVEQDARSLGAFIRLWLQNNGRTGSRVFLAGESYGGFRAALLARTLQHDVGIAPSGLILISPALEFALLYGDDFLPMEWALALPSMAATHLERSGIRGREALAARLTAVERYAMTDYLVAIAGGLVSGGAAVSARVADMIGLPEDLVRRRFGRVSPSVFIKEYERAKGLVLSRYDGLVDSADTSPESNALDAPDPVLDRSVPALTSAFVAYARDELGFKTDVSYRVLNREVSGRWDYGTSASRQGFAGVTGDLQRARALTPKLQVLIVHGYTDLVTPYMASRFLVDQMPPLAGAAPIRIVTYEGGHMMYLRPDSRRALKADADMILSTGQSAPQKGSSP